MMDIRIGICVRYDNFDRGYVLRYLGRDKASGQIKWLMFMGHPHNVSYQSKEDFLRMNPGVTCIEQVFPAEYCPTLEEIPLEALQ